MSRTAYEALQEQFGNPLEPVTIQDGPPHIDIQNFLLDVRDRAQLNMDVAGSITDGYVERTMDGASTLGVTVFDPDRVLLRSKLWGYTLEVAFGGLWWRLVNVKKDGDHVTMVFEDRIVSWLRQHKKALKVSRNKMTRAEFIQMMITEIQADNLAGIPIHFHSPELHKKQPIATPEDRKKDSKRRAARDGGLNSAADLKIKGHAANGEQIRLMERALDVAEHAGANRKVMVGMIMAITQESGWDPGATNGSHVGLLQQDPRYWPATRNVEKDVKPFIDKMIANDRGNPGYKLADLIESVQGSGQPEEYAQWAVESKKTVDEYGGGATGSITHQYYEQFQFTRGQPGGPKGENSWQAAQRLAADVRWRLFVVGNYVYYISDDDLVKSKPVLVFDDDDKGIEEINGDLMDSGKPATELQVIARMDRWAGDPGECVQLKDTMGPGAGRWLIWTINQPFFTDKTTITIKRPQDPKKEPAPTLTSTSTDAGRIYSGGTVDGAGLRDKIVNAATMAMAGKYHYIYGHQRPIPKSLFSADAQKSIDCSAFATLVYKAAGADDPNGNAYNGSGFTGTLIANGKKTGTPQRGDLVFYGPGKGPGGSPEHVGIYIGNGEVIEMGGNPGPRKLAVNYRNDLIGYYTYNLDPLNHPSQWSTEHHRTGA